MRCPTITPDEQVSDAQVHRQNPNIEPLTPPMRLMFFLIAAFCRLAKSLSHSQQMGWLVGAVGIDPDTLRIRGDLRRTGRNMDVGILLLANDLA